MAQHYHFSGSTYCRDWRVASELYGMMQRNLSRGNYRFRLTIDICNCPSTEAQLAADKAGRDGQSEFDHWSQLGMVA